MGVSTNCALAVGGLDPGGGAGLGADARAFARAGAFPTLVAALLTVQSTKGLRAVRVVPPAFVLAQAREVIANQDVRAIKIGALGSVGNVRALATLLDAHPEVPSVLDTVMVPTRGQTRLLAANATDVVLRRLVPRATLVTANVPELVALTGTRVRSVEDAVRAGAALLARGARSILVKGGHLGGPEAVDVLLLRSGAVFRFGAARLDVGDVHGTGCVLASLIAGRLATRPATTTGDVVPDAALISAIRWAKRVHHASLSRPARVGRGARVLDVR
ncbi:MAG: bifunctional hydroxymethylpyrimidine kinase/phosphomethylpyrimidine kinase [Polyangiaceae bacterium]